MKTTTLASATIVAIISCSIHAASFAADPGPLYLVQPMVDEAVAGVDFLMETPAPVPTPAVDAYGADPTMPVAPMIESPMPFYGSADAVEAASLPATESPTIDPVDPMLASGCSLDGCGLDACGPSGCCPSADPFKLPQPCLLQSMGASMSGWVQAGMTFNGYNPSDRWNGPVFLNDRANDFQMNQFWFSFDRPSNNDGCGIGVGGHVDLCYGTDWRYGDCFGLESRINATDEIYGLIIPQAYFEVAVNKLKIKMGHYASLYGQEKVPGPANFFYSHTIQMAWEPLLVTGITGEYALSDTMAVNMGVNRGWCMWEDNNDKWSLTGGVRWNVTESTLFQYNCISGKEDAAGQYNRFGHYLILDQKLCDHWNYTMQYTMVYEDNGSIVHPGNDAQIHAVAQWLQYNVSPKLAYAARFEWFSNPEGNGVAGIGHVIDGLNPGKTGAGWHGGPGFDGDFYNFTIGANYRPCGNLVIRPEVRWDWYVGTDDVGGHRPYNDGTRSNQTLFAVDFILTF